MKKKFWSFPFEGGITFGKIGHFRFAKRKRDDYSFEFGQQPTSLLDPSRFYIFRLLTLLVLLVFLGRLFWLTIIFGEKNRDLAQNNRIQLNALPAARGKIFDRAGGVLAASKRVYFLQKNDKTVEISPDQVMDLENQALAS